MIEKQQTAREDVLEFRVSGIVSETDYREVLIPALDAAVAEHENLRLLVRFDEGFEDYTLGAVLEDARVGMRHWRGFDRIAVVADATWIVRAVKAFSVFFPCPVMVFPLSGYEDARRWLTESLGAIHQTDLGGGVLHVALLGKLDSAAYAGEGEDMDAYIRAHDGRFRLLLDLREFDGWQGLGAVGEHLALVRDHGRNVEKAAIVGKTAFAQLAEGIGSRFLEAEARYFDEAAFEEAKRWIAAG